MYVNIQYTIYYKSHIYRKNKHVYLSRIWTGVRGTVASSLFQCFVVFTLLGVAVFYLYGYYKVAWIIINYQQEVIHHCCLSNNVVLQCVHRRNESGIYLWIRRHYYIRILNIQHYNQCFTEKKNHDDITSKGNKNIF